MKQAKKRMHEVLQWIPIRGIKGNKNEGEMSVWVKSCEILMLNTNWSGRL
jgi:hypothetical protein